MALGTLSWIPAAFFVLLALNFSIDALAQGDQISGAIYHPTGKEGSLRPEECPAACAKRCLETSHKKPCMFFCNKCCVTCLCVPSGTYGHKEECPCYNNWKTKEGAPKCP